MLKKLFTFFSIILCSLFLTGCINIKVADEYTVNEDRSIDHAFQILVGNNMYGFANRINDTLYENLSESGYTNIVDAYDSDSFGKKGFQHFDINEGMGYAISNDYVTVTDNSSDYFILKHVDITASIDFNKVLNDNADDDLVNFTEYKLTINLPVAFKQTNASNVYNEGKSATWYFVPKSGKGTIHFEFYIPNKDNIKLLLICVAVFFGFILLIKILSLLNSSVPASQSKSEDNSKECPNCGVRLKKDDAFCSECGCKLDNTDSVTNTINKLDNKCPNCGTELNDEDLFCGNCGYKIKDNTEVNNEM